MKLCCDAFNNLNSYPPLSSVTCYQELLFEFLISTFVSFICKLHRQCWREIKEWFVLANVETFVYGVLRLTISVNNR